MALEIIQKCWENMKIKHNNLGNLNDFLYGIKKELLESDQDFADIDDMIVFATCF